MNFEASSLFLEKYIDWLISESSIDLLPPVCTLTGTEPMTPARALTWAGSPVLSVYSMALQPTEPPQAALKPTLLGAH